MDHVEAPPELMDYPLLAICERWNKRNRVDIYANKFGLCLHANLFIETKAEFYAAQEALEKFGNLFD